MIAYYTMYPCQFLLSIQPFPLLFFFLRHGLNYATLASLELIDSPVLPLGAEIKAPRLTASPCLTSSLFSNY